MGQIRDCLAGKIRSKNKKVRTHARDFNNRVCAHREL